MVFLRLQSITRVSILENTNSNMVTPTALKTFIVFLQCLALYPFFVQIKQCLSLTKISFRISGFVTISQNFVL